MRALVDDQYQANRGDRATVNNVAVVILANRENNEVRFVSFEIMLIGRKTFLVHLSKIESYISDHNRK